MYGLTTRTIIFPFKINDLPLLFPCNGGIDFCLGSCIMVYMMRNKDKILQDIRLIKTIIEDSSIPLQLQFDCVDAMQRILNITDKQPEFSDAEIDAIYSAMGDYQDYGDEESEIANSVREKLL